MQPVFDVTPQVHLSSHLREKVFFTLDRRLEESGAWFTLNLQRIDLAFTIVEIVPSHGIHLTYHLMITEVGL